MNIHELAQRSGVGARTIRQYFGKHLLEKPPFRGAQTQYDDGHLIRIRAIRRLLHEYRMSFNAVRAELRKRSDADLAALLNPPQPAATATPAAGASASANPAGGPWLAAERWERVALLPGLELSLRADASPAVRRMAAEIATQYRGSMPVT
jgi:DNA-binding transcriptional MerR regulator